jgi:hypothetical protein
MQIGEIVLFRIDEHLLRPLLVTATHEVDPDGDLVVSGTLILQPEDLGSWWVRNRCKRIPSDMVPQAQVAGAHAGDEIGQYTRRKKEF